MCKKEKPAFRVISAALKRPSWKNINSSQEMAIHWKEKLDELVVHKLSVEEGLHLPVLTFNTDRAEGEQNIEDYLVNLGKFVREWRDCWCD